MSVFNFKQYCLETMGPHAESDLQRLNTVITN